VNAYATPGPGVSGLTGTWSGAPIRIVRPSTAAAAPNESPARPLDAVSLAVSTWVPAHAGPRLDERVRLALVERSADRVVHGT
jgi:hypothetical protein